MEGFNKFELDKVKIKKRFPKKLLYIPAIIIAIFVLLVIILLPSFNRTINDARSTYVQVQVTVDALKKQDIELAQKELDTTKTKLTQTKNNLDSMAYLKFIPLINIYYSDVNHLVNAGFHGISAAEVLLDSIEPYVDVLGLKGKGTFVSGTAEERIETAVTTMGKITPHIDDIVKYMELAKKEVDYVDPNHYPPVLGGDKVKKALTQVRQLTDQGVTLISDARPLIKILPSLLGDPSQKKYLVLFQNDKELRPTGGFITAYAIFRLDKGVIHVDRSGDIYALDNGISGKSKAADPIHKYLKVSVLHLRDSNLSPDFIKSMDDFNTLYEKASGKVEVDGIIALDTNVLVSTIKILDDEVFAGGIRFTSADDPRCSCPQVIYELERLISTPKSVDLKVTTLAAVQAQRKDMIGVLLYAIMEKALKSSPQKYWGALFQDMLAQIEQKHVMFYLYNKEAQKGIEALNAAGKIKTYEGDYLHINQANFGGAKANLFVEENVTQDYEVDGNGVIKKILTINYKNPHPPSDCNLERGNLCINAVLRDWFRIYVPKGSNLIDYKGSEVKMTSYDELDKTVFEGFLTVRPLGSATLNLTYSLPFKTKDGNLPLLIQKQPGTYGNEYAIKVKGREVSKFPLLTDKEVSIKL